MQYKVSRSRCFLPFPVVLLTRLYYLFSCDTPGVSVTPFLALLFLLVLSFVFVNVVFVSCPLSLTRPVAPFQERVENFCGRCCWSMPEFSTRPAVMYWLIKLAAVTERILGVVPRRYFFPLSVTTRKFAAPLFRFLCAAQVLLTVTLNLSLSELFTARNAASRWQLRLLNFCLCVCVCPVTLRVQQHRF